MTSPSRFHLGLLSALSAFFMWGALPLYWKLLQAQAPMEIFYHRTLWSMVFLSMILLVGKPFQALKQLMLSPRAMVNALVSTVLIGGNWLLYIWAVTSDHVIETSLGYYLSPLVSILLGTVFLQEKLRKAQWIAVGFAAFGVALLTAQLGTVPWIALSLATTFSLYGFLKKFLSLDAGIRLWFETLALTIGLVIYGWLTPEAVHTTAFWGYVPHVQLLLIGAGIVTAMPMWCYGYASRALPLSTLGFLQYLAPTMQLLLGIFIFHESFTRSHFFAFMSIWLAIALFIGDSFRSWNRGRL